LKGVTANPKIVIALSEQISVKHCVSKTALLGCTADGCLLCKKSYAVGRVPTWY